MNDIGKAPSQKQKNETGKQTAHFDIAALGESLIDFTYKGRSEAGLRLFEQNPGGAPLNVAAAVAKFGGRAAFIGKVGCDMHGQFLLETMRKAGIDTAQVIEDPSVFTTLAFVNVGEDGQRTFSFARKPGADTCLRAEELNEGLLGAADIFHFGSLSLTDEPVKSAVKRAVKIAKAAGAAISFDPNYRAPLWSSEDTARKEVLSILPEADLLKLSDEETALFSGEKSPERAAEFFLRQGVSAVVVTLGARGAYAANAEGGAYVPALSVRAVDTTGAGDAFWGGFLWSLLEQLSEGRSSQAAGNSKPLLNAVKKAPLSVLLSAARFGNAAAGLSVEKSGAIPSLPDCDAVRARLKSMEESGLD